MPYIPKAERDRREIQRLRSTNPTYDLFAPRWDYYLASYEGGPEFANKHNLFKHTREHDKDYDERVKRVYYQNEIENLVDFHSDYIFQETIQRDGGKDKEFYNKFIANVNKKGDDITAFMYEQAVDTDVYGMTYVLVDAPKQPDLGGRTLTKFDEQKLGLQPYWVAIPPMEILDWVMDAFGVYEYIKRQQVLTILNGNQPKKVERYTEYTFAEITITDVDVSKPQAEILSKETVTNPIGAIPIERIRFKTYKRYPEMGKSMLLNLADAGRELLNLKSLEQEFLYRQCFNILAMEAEESVPFKEQEEGETGSSNALIYPRGAKPPQYIAPDPAPADKMEQAQDRVVAAMFRAVAQDVMNDMFNGGKSSGFSKSQSFQKSVPKIASRAEVLEDAENRLMRLTMKFKRRDWTGSIKYKDRYEITNLTDWLTQLVMLFSDLGLPLASPTFAKEQLKKALFTFDGKIDPDTMTKALAEIEKMDLTKWFDRLLPAQVTTTSAGARVTSAAAQQKPKQSGTMAEVKSESDKNNATKVTKKLR
jgi:ribosomal protein L12E/L44/L45/RPP1/RPP2